MEGAFRLLATIDWAMALNALGRQEIDADVVQQTLVATILWFIAVQRGSLRWRVRG
jgi:hypothetical protein